MSTSTCVYLNLCLPLPVSTSTCVYLYLCLPLPVSTSTCVYLYLCLPLAVSTCTCVYLYLISSSLDGVVFYYLILTVCCITAADGEMLIAHHGEKLISHHGEECELTTQSVLHSVLYLCVVKPVEMLTVKMVVVSTHQMWWVQFVPEKPPLHVGLNPPQHAWWLNPPHTFTKFMVQVGTEQYLNYVTKGGTYLCKK